MLYNFFSRLRSNLALKDIKMLFPCVILKLIVLFYFNWISTLYLIQLIT